MENQKKPTTEINELSSEKMKQKEVQEFINSVESLTSRCREKNIPIICLTNDPESSTVILSLQGSNVDFIILLSEAIDRIPTFDKVVKKALEIALLKKMDRENIESLLRETFGEN